MKGQLPIVIAFILLSALLIATLYYISSITAVSGIPTSGYTSMDWVRVSEELDNLVYLCLRIGSQKADEKFTEVYDALAQSALNDFLYGTISYTEYLNRLNNAVSQAAVEADNAMEEAVNWIIGNWSILKYKTGYVVEIQDLRADYVVDYGFGYSEVYMKARIISPIGEYRVFTKQLKLYYALNLTLYVTWPISISSYMEFRAMTYIEKDGIKLYYLIPKDRIGSIMVSILYYLSEGEITSEKDPVGVYYYGRGITNMLFEIVGLEVIEDLFNYLVTGDVIGVTSAIEVDGLVARTALKGGTVIFSP